MIPKLIAVSIAGGILCLDRVVLQAMISRPIVAAPVIGLILGDPYTGLIAGAFIELLWVDRLPIGNYLPPNDTVVSILITAASIQSAHLLGGPSRELLVLAVLIIAPLGILAQRLDLWLGRGNEKLAEAALRDASRGDVRSVSRRHLFAILRSFLLAVVFIFASLAAVIPTLTWLSPRLGTPITRGLALLYGFLPLLGAAVALNTISVRGAIPVFCAAFLCATMIIGFLRSG
ncbi:MAG: PTS sugar transporter subunit IIC [Syntrophales bacterium]